MWTVPFKRQDDKPCAAAIEKYLKRKKYFKFKEEKKGEGAICKFSYLLQKPQEIGINDKRLLCIFFSPHEGQLQTSITFRVTHCDQQSVFKCHPLRLHSPSQHIDLDEASSMKGRPFPEFPVVNKSRGMQEKMRKTKTTATFTSLITSVRCHFGPSLMKCKIMSLTACQP